MVLLDSNIFIIDRFFPRDAHYARNRVFIERLGEEETAVSVFTLLEICGVAGFNLSATELDYWLYQFPAAYPVLVLDPFGMESQGTAEWVRHFLGEVTQKIRQRMTFGDAMLLREAEGYGVEALVTWNTKDFIRRTKLLVFTPESYLRRKP